MIGTPICHFESLLGLRKLVVGFLLLHLGHIRVRHSVGTNNVPAKRQSAQLIVRHHERARFDRQASLQFLFDALDELFLFCAAELAASVGSHQKRLFAAGWIIQVPRLGE